MKKSYIYALSWDNKTKIGYSADPQKRKMAICSQAGVKLSDAVFSYYETTMPRKVEKLCHEMASKKYKRLAGEWFLCSQSQAISIIISNVIGDVHNEEENPELDKLLSDLKTSLTAGISTVVSSDFGFSDSEFGDITVIKINNENWFVLKEVMQILGYSSQPSSMIERVRDTFNKAGINPIFYKKIKEATNNGVKTKIVINEQGLFELLTFGNTKEAILFRHWVIQNVLTGIIDYE